MADLESTLHYSLRVEVATHTVLKGEVLISLKKYMAVLAKVKLPVSAPACTHTVRRHKTHKMCKPNEFKAMIT